MTNERAPIRVGDRAPEVTLPAVQRDGVVDLADFRGRSAVLLGIPRIEVAPGPAQWPYRMSIEEIQRARINPTGELAEPMSPFAANDALNNKDGFVLTETDRQTVAAHGTQLTAHILIDRDGIVRWTFVEAAEGIGHLARFPMPSALLAAARSLAA